MPNEVSEACQFEYIVKKSQFITYIYPIESKKDVHLHINTLKKRYPDARHICYAFLVGNHSGMADDGEPSGTAGKPIFSILQYNDLVNTLAVVVRYFGGIKLGAGGLIRAYGQAVNQCLDQTTLIKQIPKTSINVTCDFSLENKIRHFCSNEDNKSHEILQCQYSNDLTMTITLPSSEVNNTTKQLIELCAGNVDVLVLE
ncbi:MAG: YigZ family protein [Saccharospirillaceae bacterium]|nr:YigZ family protein [Pseudomonadales bacterium]NRB79219.1 YigZ family protein [Saccharospirillaceae bacterium]